MLPRKPLQKAVTYRPLPGPIRMPPGDHYIIERLGPDGEHWEVWSFAADFIEARELVDRQRGQARMRMRIRKP